VKIFLKIFLFTLLIKLSLIFVGVLVANFTDYKFIDQSSFKIDQLKPQKWNTIFNRFDSNWFDAIARDGHSKVNKADLVPNEHNNFNQSYYAFFPLYPMLMGGIMKITGADFITVAWWVSFFLTPFAFFLFYKLALLELKNPDHAWLATLCIMLFPANYYYYNYYTETLFLVLVLSAFLLAYHKKYIALCLVMVPLALVRPNGLLIALPLVLYFAEQHDPGFKNLLSFKLKSWLPLFAALTILAVTFLVYCYYLYEMTGDPLAFSTAQKGWHRFFKLPWFTVWHASGPLDPYFAGYTLFLLGFILITLQHWRLSFFVFMVISIVLPLSTGVNTSMPRFWSVIFPLFIAMGVVIAQWKYGKYLPYLFWLLMLCNFVFWVIEHPFAI
jgi:hypothetical protein